MNLIFNNKKIKTVAHLSSKTVGLSLTWLETGRQVFSRRGQVRNKAWDFLHVKYISMQDVVKVFRKKKISINDRNVQRNR